MKHLYVPVPRPKSGRGSRGPLTVVTRCGAAVGENDTLVDAALASDCDDCRVSAGVARMGDQAYGGGKIGVKPIPVYIPQPMVGAEDIREIRKRRNGK